MLHFYSLGFHHVLIHLSQYSLITYYMPGTMQDAEERPWSCPLLLRSCGLVYKADAQNWSQHREINELWREASTRANQIYLSSCNKCTLGGTKGWETCSTLLIKKNVNVLESLRQDLLHSLWSPLLKTENFKTVTAEHSTQGSHETTQLHPHEASWTRHVHKIQMSGNLGM